MNVSEKKLVYLASASLFARLRKKRDSLLTFFDTLTLNCDWPTIKTSMFCQDLRDGNSAEIQNTMTSARGDNIQNCLARACGTCPPIWMINKAVRFDFIGWNGGDNHKLNDEKITWIEKSTKARNLNRMMLGLN